MQPNICIPLRYVLYKYIKANRHDVFPAVTLVIYCSRCQPLEQLRYQLGLEMACIYLCLSGMRVILRSTYCKRALASIVFSKLSLLYDSNTPPELF